MTARGCGWSAQRIPHGPRRIPVRILRRDARHPHERGEETRDARQRTREMGQGDSKAVGIRSRSGEHSAEAADSE